MKTITLRMSENEQLVVDSVMDDHCFKTGAKAVSYMLNNHIPMLRQNDLQQEKIAEMMVKINELETTIKHLR